MAVKGFKNQTNPESPREKENIQWVAWDCLVVVGENETAMTDGQLPTGLQGEKSPQKSRLTPRSGNRKAVFKVG